MPRAGLSLFALLGLLGVACDRAPLSDPAGSADPAAGTETGQLTLRLQTSGFEGLASLRVRIIDPDAGDPCRFARPIAEKILPITGSTVETTFVLIAERWAACLQPLDQFGNEVSRCFGQIGFIPVVANSTIEVSGAVTCQAAFPSGAAHISVSFNHAPVIETLDIQPGLSLTTCDTAAISVTAGDLDGDPIDYFWFVSKRPFDLPDPAFSFDGPAASFHADAAGRYDVSVTPHDGRGSGRPLTFSLQVTAATCP
jgi:hypothetical protein